MMNFRLKNTAFRKLDIHTRKAWTATSSPDVKFTEASMSKLRVPKVKSNLKSPLIRPYKEENDRVYWTTE